MFNPVELAKDHTSSKKSDLYDEIGNPIIKPNPAPKTNFIKGKKYFIPKPPIKEMHKKLTHICELGGNKMTFMGQFGDIYLFLTQGGNRTSYTAFDLYERGV